MSNHSEGKWEIRKFTNLARNEDNLHILAGKRMVAKVTNHPGECDSLYEHVSDEDRANAHLIAAAPELLEALKLCLSDDAGDLEPETVHLAMNAIAKAEGRDNE